MPQKRKEKEKEVKHDDYTPVKASTSRLGGRRLATCEKSPSPIGSRLASAVCEEDTRINQDSPELVFSPNIKLTQDDVVWAWKSPIGRSHTSTGPTSKRRLQGKTPVQKTKRSFKSYSPDSPVASLPSKRKLIKHEDNDRDYLSDLTSQLQALTDHMDDRPSRVETPVETPVKTSVETLAKRPVDETLVEPGPVPPLCSTPKVKSTSRLSALLDDDDGFDLFQCSQFIEEKLTRNPDKVIFSPIQVNCVASKLPAVVGKPATMLPPNKGKVAACTSTRDERENAKVNHKSVDTTKLLTNNGTSKQLSSCQVTGISVPLDSSLMGTLLSLKQETLDSGDVPNNAASCSKYYFEVVKKVSEPTCPKPTLENSDKAKTDSKLKFEVQDDSFDAVLLNFCEENMELLSQTKKDTNLQPETSDITPAISRPSPNLLPSIPSKTLPVHVSVTSAHIEGAHVSNHSEIKVGLQVQSSRNVQANSNDMTQVKPSCNVQAKSTDITRVNRPSSTPCSIAPSKAVCTPVPVNIARKETAPVFKRDIVNIRATSSNYPCVETLPKSLAMAPSSSRHSSSVPSTSIPNTRIASVSVPMQSTHVGTRLSKLEETNARTKSNSKDEDFLQPELLNILESIESTLVQSSQASVPLKCTPEEIAKKRAQARMKLQNKKKASLDGICRLPNPYLKGKLQS